MPSCLQAEESSLCRKQLPHSPRIQLANIPGEADWEMQGTVRAHPPYSPVIIGAQGTPITVCGKEKGENRSVV